MSFKDAFGKKYNLTVRHVKEDVADGDILTLMDNIIDNQLIKPGNAEFTDKVSAEVVTKETNEVAI